MSETEVNYERLAIKPWFVDSDSLEAAGIKPGIYRHWKGGEYLTLNSDWRMHQDNSNESVGARSVSYVALYDHPEYGPNACWNSQVQEFLGVFVVDGQEVHRFTFVEDWPS
jgi:hypothetical protein